MDKAQVMNKLIEHYRLHRNVDFAKFFDISEQNAYGWKRGGYNIYVVYQHCPEINPEWLLSDGEKGEMLRSPEVPTAEHEDYRDLLDKSLDNVGSALDRLANEQSISKQIIAQTDKVLELVRDASARN